MIKTNFRRKSSSCAGDYHGGGRCGGSVLAVIILLLCGCAAPMPTVVTERYDSSGRMTQRTVATVDSQTSYYEAIKSRDQAIASEPAIMSLQWQVVTTANSRVYLPSIKLHREREYAEIERTPTSGEVAVQGVNGFMERLGVPLAIGGITAVSVQASRTSEEIKPNTTAGGDVVQAERSGQAESDKSSRVTTTTVVEKSFNNSEETTEIVDGETSE